jgi:hypothetical protein
VEVDVGALRGVFGDETAGVLEDEFGDALGGAIGGAFGGAVGGAVGDRLVGAVVRVLVVSAFSFLFLRVGLVIVGAASVLED